MTKDDIIKTIDGIPYYNYDYIGFLYNELEDRDKKIEEVIKKIKQHRKAKELLCDLYSDDEILLFILKKLGSDK